MAAHPRTVIRLFVHSTTHFDFIIAGAGAAGLSLAWNIVQSPALQSRKILLIDRSFTPRDDKTWCFWDDSLIPDPTLINLRWNRMQVSAGKSLFQDTLRRATYYCLRSADFGRWMVQQLTDHPQITWLASSITEIRDTPPFGTVETEAGVFTGDYVFQSVQATITRADRIGMLQHFAGFDISTEKPRFDPARMTLMDFRVPQFDGTAFMYVLPANAHQALVEYTVFSQQLLSEAQYHEAIEAYLEQHYSLTPDQYTVDRREKGVIPMSEAEHATRRGSHIFALGVASGLTKPSTGYAFTRILRQTRGITEQLARGEVPDYRVRSARRFRFYDLLLLDILRKESGSSEAIFTALFRRNPMDDVLQFLDEQTDISTEIGIFTSLPWGPFIRSLLRNLPYVVTGRF